MSAMARSIGLYIIIVAIFVKAFETSSYVDDEKFRYVKATWDGAKYTIIEPVKNQRGREEVISKWPPGPYALPMPVDGCPETRQKGWKEGYIDITWQQPHAVLSNINSSEVETPKQPIDITYTELPNTQSHLIGPYSKNRIKLNFCFKLRRKKTLDTGTWPNGDYSIYGDNSECPNGFTSEIIKVRLGKISYYTYDGALPEFRLDMNDTNADYLELRICSHVEENEPEQVPIEMTQEYSFIFLYTRIQSLHCPVMGGMVVTEESLYLQQSEGSNLTQLLRFCYFQPKTWTHDHYSMRPDNSAIPEGIYEVKVKGITSQLSQSTFQESDIEANGFMAVLLSDATVSTHLTWTLLDMGRTLSVFGTFIAISIWPVKDEDGDFLRCYYSDRKWDFLHFEASVCSYDVEYLNAPVSNRTFDSLELYGHLLKMKRIIESRYLTFITGHRENPNFVHNDATEFLVLTTNYSYLTDESAHCNIDLGMTDNGIDDFQISASSSLPRFPAVNARPFLSSWCADRSDKFPYILVDLFRIMTVEGVTVMNKKEAIETIDKGSLNKAYTAIGARAFTIKYGESKDKLTSYRNKVFRLNPLYLVEEPQTFVFSFRFYARYVKIRVLEPLASNISCLRFELHGCRKIGTKPLQCSSSRTMKHVQALIDLYRQPLNTFYNLTLTECNSLCINYPECSIVKSITGGECLHYESNHYKRWMIDTTDIQNAIWSSKFCGSDYIESSYSAYTVSEVSSQHHTMLTYMAIITEASILNSPFAILTSIGFPLNYKAGERYKWIIKFDVFAFIGLIFSDINLNVYKNNLERTDFQDHLLFNEETHLFNEDVSGEYPFLIDNRFNGKTFFIETKVSYLTLSFNSFEKTDEVFHRGTGFRVAVYKNEFPACLSFRNLARISTASEEMCIQPTMLLSSRSYYNIPFIGKTEKWTVYAARGIFRIYILHFDIECNPETSFFFQERKYCNFDMPVEAFDMLAIRGIKLNLTIANPKDAFRLAYIWFKHEIVPESITSKAADIPAIYRSMEYLSWVTGDTDLRDSLNYVAYNYSGYGKDFYIKQLAADNYIPNFPWLLYKACSEKFKKCYSIFSYYGSWNFAGGECWIRGQNLVTIGSKEESDVIKYLLRNFRFLADNYTGLVESVFKSEFYYAYIGLHRVQNQLNRHTFVWENRSPATFSDWNTSEPSSGDCTRMGFFLEHSDNTWETRDCLSNSAFYFVCEEVISNATKEITDRLFASQYTGSMNVTSRGYTCQRWDSQYPYTHDYNMDSMFPEKSVRNAANFCRDPSMSKVLWCYTTDPDVQWDTCYLNELKETVSSIQYQGYLDRTIDGKKCSKRNNSDSNYCRHSDSAFSLMCYSKSESSESFCSLRDTANDRCRHLRQPPYNGTMNVTASGKACQRWKLLFSQDNWLADTNFEDAYNYCRDPESKGFQWCYFAYPAWEICTIEKSIEDANLSAVDYFECNDGRRVDVSKRCNGVINCDDLSDEIDCVTRVHPLLQNIKLAENSEEIIGAANEYLYRCTSQEVISFLAVCDGVLDCQDASDEIICTHVDVGTCAEDQFKCNDGSCIHISLYCNVNNDCIDGSDENCDYYCPQGYFMCDSGGCLLDIYRCDGFPSCLDMADEDNCKWCSGSAFHCDNVRCLRPRLVCDMYPDCVDGTDEMSCELKGMLNCMDWWNAGYRETGIYTIEVSQSSETLEVERARVTCNFDYTADAKVYTIFQSGDLVKPYQYKTNSEILFSKKGDGYFIDEPTRHVWYGGGSSRCTQQVLQSCKPSIQALAAVDDPYHSHIYSHCTCIIVELLINRVEISSVRHCYDTESFDKADIDHNVLFNYKYSMRLLGRIIEWKNVTVNVDDLHLVIGGGTCIEELSAYKPTACVEGNHAYEWPFRCWYALDLGFIAGCRSGSHLQNCDLIINECPVNTVRCPGSYCIPLKFVCDEVEHCPNSEDELGCGCEDVEREVLVVYEKGSIRGPDITKLVKQLHTSKSTLRSLVYATSELPIGIPYLHRLLEIKDKEIKRSELIDRNYECEYKLLANEFLTSVKFTKKKKKAILFIQNSPESELVANLMFSNIKENHNITIYRAMEAPSSSFRGNMFSFVIDVAVKNWKILSSLASRYLPEICREAFLTTSPGLYKCSSSKMSIPVGMVCDQTRDCMQGDDESVCYFNCPVGCNCRGYAMSCKVVDWSKIALNSFAFTRSLTVSRSSEAEITLASNELNLNLPFLYLLNISSCKIKHIESQSFLTLVNLRVLDLSNNVIKTLFPLVFIGLQNLYTLILDGNSYLEKLEPFTFQYLKSIKHLRIAGTKIKILSSHTFAGLSLERLDLESNNFEYIEEFGLGNLEVENIYFEFNSISSFDEGIFTAVSSLKYLRTPSYKYCCLRPYYLPEESCFPEKDEFSSCEDLMRNSVLQSLIWIIGLGSLLGNIFSFIYRLKVDRGRFKIAYGIFVTNLAVADFLMGIYLVIIAVADAVFRKRYIFMDDYWRNSAWCTLAGVLSTLSSEASVMFIFLITLDRLLVIKYPFGQVRLTGKKAAFFSLLAWILCSVIALFPVMYTDYFRNSFYTRTGVCIALQLTRDRPPGWLYSVLIFIGLNFTTFLLIAAGQWYIFTNLRNKSKRLAKTRKQDLTVARNILFLVATDFLCWFPLGCVGLMALSGHVISSDVYAWTAVFILPVNSTLNPFLYTVLAIIGKKHFTPRIDEQAKPSLRPDVITSVIMQRFNVHESCSENVYTNLGEILQRQEGLPLGVILRISCQLTQTLQVLHESSLMMGSINAQKLYIKVAKNKIIGDIQLHQEPNRCKTRTDTCIDMYELGRLLRTLLRNSKTKKAG